MYFNLSKVVCFLFLVIAIEETKKLHLDVAKISYGMAELYYGVGNLDSAYNYLLNFIPIYKEKFSIDDVCIMGINLKKETKIISIDQDINKAA